MLRVSSSKLISPDNKVLLKQISFHIPKGRLAYLCGPNGVGKTSLIKGILGLDFSLKSLERNFKTYSYLPQIENKEFLLPVLVEDISKNGSLLTDEERSIPWNNASGGQRKKALLELSLDRDSDLYVLDEPYNHLDTKSINLINEVIRRRLQEGKTILMVSHHQVVEDKNLVMYLDVEKWK